MMDWIFYAFVGAAALHVLEEYFYPGGFPDFMKKMAPRFAPFITTKFAITINGLFLLLCVGAAVVVRSKSPILSLSVASLLLFNGLTHILGSLRAGRYAPGLITGILLYIPLGITAYYLSWGSGLLSAAQTVISALLGVAYQIVPLAYLGLASLLKRV